MFQYKNHPLYRRHNIDTAMNSLWDFYKKNFIVLFLLSLVMSLVVQYISTKVNISEIQSITDPGEMLEKMKEFIWPMVIISVINLLFTTIIHHYILHNPVDRNNTIFSSLFKSLKYFLPYLILIILLAFAGFLAVIVGLFVFVVGAIFSLIYVLMIYLFILPVMMVEETDISRTITRIFRLAHIKIWSNLGWVAVSLILLIVISLILSGIILIPFSGSFIRNMFNPENAADTVELAKNPVFIILSAIVNAITFPILPIFAYILYFNSKSGEDSSTILAPPDKEPERVKVEDLYAKPYSDDHPENPSNKEK